MHWTFVTPLPNNRPRKFLGRAEKENRSWMPKVSSKRCFVFFSQRAQKKACGWSFERDRGFIMMIYFVFYPSRPIRGVSCWWPDGSRWMPKTDCSSLWYSKVVDGNNRNKCMQLHVRKVCTLRFNRYILACIPAIATLAKMVSYRVINGETFILPHFKINDSR